MINNCLANLFLLIVLSGCTGIESVVIGSALNLVGNEGLEYFSSGKAKRIIFHDIERVDSVVENAFVVLSYKLEKRQMFADRSLRYLGNAGDDAGIDLQVKLQEVADGITELTVVARDELYLPEGGICLLLLKEIMTQAALRQQQITSQTRAMQAVSRVE